VMKADCHISDLFTHMYQSGVLLYEQDKSQIKQLKNLDAYCAFLPRT